MLINYNSCLFFCLLVLSTELGGTVVLRSMRLPLVAVGSVECEASCSGASALSARAAIPTTSIKVEIQWGANPRWVALSLFDELDTSEVWVIDATNERHLMKREVH